VKRSVHALLDSSPSMEIRHRAAIGFNHRRIIATIRRHGSLKRGRPANCRTRLSRHRRRHILRGDRSVLFAMTALLQATLPSDWQLMAGQRHSTNVHSQPVPAIWMRNPAPKKRTREELLWMKSLYEFARPKDTAFHSTRIDFDRRAILKREIGRPGPSKRIWDG
jgi:hypothetical protein